MTNYYQAFINVDKILKTYTKEDDKEIIVLFLTDGYPNENTPNEVGFYKYLKSAYPYVTFNAVQYEMGASILEPITKVSDNQYLADMETLNNVLFDASVNPITYDNFEISDFIDTRYFYIDSDKDIKSDIGNIIFDKTSQKVTWKIDNLKSGSKTKLTIKARLKTELIGQGGIYPTNEHEEVKSKIEQVDENINSKETPVLADNYKVKYEANAPDGCSVEGVPLDENHSVFDTVDISRVKPICSGYQFKGWDIVVKSAKKINDDYFIMPEENVTIKGVWSKIAITKSMQGTVKESITLYEQISNEAKSQTKNIKKYEGDTSTFTGDHDIYYYQGETANNNVIFANYCWKIIRTTDTGGVKLLYNGVPDANETCNNTGVNSALTSEQMNTSSTVAFNSSSSSPADVGYMYNTRYVYNRMISSSTQLTTSVKYGNSFTWDGASYTLTDTVDSIGIPNEIDTHHYTCWNATGICTNVNYIYFIDNNYAYYAILKDGKDIKEALNEMLYNDDVNTNNSTIKTAIDYWYKKNMTKYTTYLEDTVWCNDRSPAADTKDTNGWNPDGGSTSTYLYFKSSNDLQNLTCKNKNDKFTVDKANGNGALTYPVGMIDAAETTLSSSEGTPFKTDSYYWGLSPYWFSSAFPLIYDVHPNGYPTANQPKSEYGVRPAISLKKGIKYSYGNGSVDNPYVVDDAILKGIVIIESKHRPYLNDLHEEREKTFEGASSLAIKLEYQTEGINWDYIYLYDSTGKEYGKYGGNVLKTETITIPGNYIKILFHTDNINNYYYGYKATITPNYD